MKVPVCFLMFVVLPWSAVAATAPGPVIDKSKFSLVNPTPDALLREMSTDRPDATESPFTVDAGHKQIEMDVVNFTRDKAGGDRFTEWGVVPFNLRFGLQQNIEAAILLVPYMHVTERPTAGRKSTQGGAGDLTLRGKLNFWGNDGGATACGMIADLKLPTARRGLGNRKLEGAVALPVAFELGGGWEGAAMTKGELRYIGGDYRFVWNNTITCGHDITEDVGGFLEFTSSTNNGPHVATFNTGLTKRLGKHTQLDAGVNFGLSRAAPDIGLFAGLSRRL